MSSLEADIAAASADALITVFGARSKVEQWLSDNPAHVRRHHVRWVLDNIHRFVGEKLASGVPPMHLKDPQ